LVGHQTVQKIPDPPADSTSTPIRILAVAREPLLVDCIGALREEYSDLELVGAATAGAEAVAMASLLQPDIVLIDRELADADGIELCDRLRVQLADGALIIVSKDASDETVLRAVESGACGVISKLALDQDLVEAILRAAEGEFLLPRSVTLRLFRTERDLRCHKTARRRR
jgi:two-component system, NarL family, response regulator DevR